MTELVEGMLGGLSRWRREVVAPAQAYKPKRLRLEHYVTLGQNITVLLNFLDDPHCHLSHASILRNGERRELDVAEALIAVIGQLRDGCSELGLTLSVETIDSAVMSGLAHSSQIKTLVLVVQNEMAKKLFLHIPEDRSRFWEADGLLSDRAKAVFKVGAAEVRASATAYAYGLWNASIFHSMRAAEDGLRSLAEKFGLQSEGAEQWGNIINRLESKLIEIAKQPKTSDEKKQHLQPLSELVVDLRLFKDAWRNQNAHTVLEYSGGQALTVLNAVCRFLDACVPRISR